MLISYYDIKMSNISLLCENNSQNSLWHPVRDGADRVKFSVEGIFFGGAVMRLSPCVRLSLLPKAPREED